MKVANVMRSVPGAIATGSREASTGSGPGSPRGQPAWGGGSDRMQLTHDRGSRSRDPVVIAPGTDSVAEQTNIAATAHRDVGTTDLRDGHLSAYLQSPGLPHAFNETFGVNS